MMLLKHKVKSTVSEGYLDRGTAIHAVWAIDMNDDVQSAMGAGVTSFKVLSTEQVNKELDSFSGMEYMTQQLRSRNTKEPQT
jgi:hypothetical protein